jgi:putative MFS transporter
VTRAGGGSGSAMGGEDVGATRQVDARAGDLLVARLERLPLSRFHLRLIALLGAGTFFDSYDSLAIGVVLTVVFRTLHISLVLSGVLISVAYVGQLVGSLLAGWLAERHGRKPLFVVALLVFGIFSVVAGLAWNYPSLLVVRLLQGFGLGAEVPIAGALFNEFVRGERRGLVVIGYESLFAWGIFATPLLGLAAFGLFGTGNGWRALFFLGGLPIVVAIVAMARLPESARWLVAKGRLQEAEAVVGELEREAGRGGSLPEPRVVVRADTKPTRLTELFSPQYRRRTALSWTQWFTSYFVTYGFTTTWLPSLYVRLGHLPVSDALLLAAASNGLQLANGYLFAGLVDRIGRKPFFVFGFALASAGMLAGLLAIQVFHATGWPLLFAVGVIVALGAGYSNIGVYLYTPELFPTRMRAWATATGGAVNRVASAIGPTAVGALLGAGLGLGSVFLLMLAMMLLGLIVMAALGVETKQRVLEELAS